jgi:hypothetical protein
VDHDDIGADEFAFCPGFPAQAFQQIMSRFAFEEVLANRLDR